MLSNFGYRAIRGLSCMLVAAAMALSLIGCSEGQAETEPNQDAGSSVSITVECESNLLLSKYDIAVYVDADSLGTLDHGTTKTFEATLADGDHELRFAKEDDGNVDGSVGISINGDTSLKYRVKCTSSQVEIEQIDSVFPPISSDEASTKYHDELYRAFEEAGFTNIREEELRDLTPDQSDKNWLVGSVSIGGAESFSVQDAFAADEEVVISYHVLADLNPPASSDELEGMGYENVVELFEDAGFINVTTTSTSASGVGGTVSSVKIGGIFGSSDFTTSDSFPFDAGVEITYYEGASTSDESMQPPAEEVPEEDLSSLLASSDTDASWFSSAYRDRTITFDGWVADMMNHENYDTRYDVLILAGDNGVSPMTGPNFRLTDVNFYDMNVTNADSLRGGDNITITAIVGDYNSTADWLELDPVSISVR